MSSESLNMNGPHTPPEKISRNIEKPQRKVESREWVSPKLAMKMNSEVLASLADQYPGYAEMFKIFSELPPMRFEHGKVAFIFGPNGSGKSTLANAIYLAAEIEYRTPEILARHPISFPGEKEKKPLTAQQAKKKAMDDALHPTTSTRYAVAELISMGAAPLLVENEAVTLPQFQARKGFSSGERSLSDTPIIHRIAVQDMLGEARESEHDYLFAMKYGNTSIDGEKFFRKSSYAEYGASARQMIEEKLKQQFERINPGSIVIIDEAAFGLSPKRQEEYIQMLERFAEEKDLIIIAPENSGYAYDTASNRIDLESPKLGLHLSETREGEVRNMVEPIDSQESEYQATVEFVVDHDKMQKLAEDNPKFRPMLEEFAKLPDTFSFGSGKTEIFGDNGAGKTTLLGVIYLLMKIERNVQDGKRREQWEKDEAQIRAKEMEYYIGDPRQLVDRVFVESIGFAKELIMSGALKISNKPVFPPSRRSTMEGVTGLMWVNLLDVAGEVKTDTYRIVEHTRLEAVGDIAREVRDLRPDRTQGSTRQTAESQLLQTIEHMPKGGYLFVDEIDGGISPGRQLKISDKVNKLAKEMNITIVATTNSYEGYKYRLTHSLDLSTPRRGIIAPEYRLK